MAGFLKGWHRCIEMLENDQDFQGKTYPMKSLISPYFCSMCDTDKGLVKVSNFGGGAGGIPTLHLA